VGRWRNTGSAVVLECKTAVIAACVEELTITLILLFAAVSGLKVGKIITYLSVQLSESGSLVPRTIFFASLILFLSAFFRSRCNFGLTFPAGYSETGRPEH
jgi:hypothetical protein